MDTKGRPVTIKDIARELNISPSTVSRALKGYDTISEKTRKTVQELAEKYHYQPNSIALSLRQQKSFTIGVIIPEIVHFFFSTVISGIEDVAYRAGYNVIISQTNESLEREISDTKALMRNRVDGLLISLSRETTTYDHLHELNDRGVPMVFFDRICPEIPTSRVIVDDMEGARLGVQHLIDIGCKRIAHLRGHAGLEISENRLQGYKQALEANGLPFDEELVVICDDSSVDQSILVTQKLLALDKRPDGIFAWHDVCAMGAMKAIFKAGLNVPKDIAIVGFSDWQFAALVHPSLTSIHQSGFEMGQAAARLFIDQIDSKSAEFVPRTEVVPTRLVIRDSTSR
ncbi:MAG: LacI family DNA-binding transcriptional regulator [Cyclobacteriaceae bacterium]